MDFLKDLFRYENHSRVCGLTDELCILYYYNYFKNNDNNVLVVTNSLYDSNKIFQKLKTYTNDVCLFPMDDFLSTVALAISPDLKVTRLETLEYVKNHDKCIVVTNLMGYLRFLPSIEKSKNLNIRVIKNSSINRDEFISKLEEFGYSRTSLVTSTGEYAVRGFIIDIFPIDEEHPIRIEFFGDNIESIRFFNEETQLSINEIENFNILPIQEINFEEHSSLFDYMFNPMVFFIDENQILSGYEKLIGDIKDYNESQNLDENVPYMYSYEEINPDNLIKIETINNVDNSIVFNSKSVVKFKGDYEKLVSFCNDLKFKNTIIICLSKDKQIERISELFDKVNFNCIVQGEINIIKQKINEGFIIDNYILISEFDIDDLKITNVYKNNYKIGRKIKSFDDLKLGDYVVHSQHGIGSYGCNCAFN